MYLRMQNQTHVEVQNVINATSMMPNYEHSAIQEAKDRELQECIIDNMFDLLLQHEKN